jgi:DNA-binding response OmpR family regulator/anti-sigma regulatory factor (Ser/Thr protein kinase)
VRLQQVIVNLISNALDAMEGRAVKEIGISVDTGDAGKCAISVRDRGPGLSEAALSQAFDPFFTTKDPGKGMGLGLSISYNIIRDFDGTLSVANHPEGGAVFTVTLHRWPRPTGRCPMQAGGRMSVGSEAGTVLFVDDERDLRAAAAQALELEELDVILCDGAEAALTHLGPEFRGVLVTDIRMPGTDGIALMHAALDRDADLPVILVTGHGDVELAVQSMRDGAYDFIEKPYAPARLIETVRRALEKRRLTLENRALRAAVAVPETGADPVAARLHGQSAPMRALRRHLRAVAATEADVLIEGATGTGKDLAPARCMRPGNAPGVPSCRSTAPPCPRA